MMSNVPSVAKAKRKSMLGRGIVPKFAPLPLPNGPSRADVSKIGSTSGSKKRLGNLFHSDASGDCTICSSHKKAHFSVARGSSKRASRRLLFHQDKKRLETPECHTVGDGLQRFHPAASPSVSIRKLNRQVVLKSRNVSRIPAPRVLTGLKQHENSELLPRPVQDELKVLKKCEPINESSKSCDQDQPKELKLSEKDELQDLKKEFLVLKNEVQALKDQAPRGDVQFLSASSFENFMKEFSCQFSKMNVTLCSISEDVKCLVHQKKHLEASQSDRGWNSESQAVKPPKSSSKQSEQAYNDLKLQNPFLKTPSKDLLNNTNANMDTPLTFFSRRVQEGLEDLLDDDES